MQRMECIVEGDVEPLPHKSNYQRPFHSDHHCVISGRNPKEFMKISNHFRTNPSITVCSNMVFVTSRPVLLVEENFSHLEKFQIERKHSCAEIVLFSGKLVYFV